jgi:chromosome segregation ATPase
MSEVKPVSIKTWQEHLTNVFYSDSDETQCRDKEVAELRAALEAQAKRIADLEFKCILANGHTIEEMAKEIEALRKQLENITAVINEYYAALDNRQHGGIAQSKAFDKVQNALGMQWIQGSTLSAQKGTE